MSLTTGGRALSQRRSPSAAASTTRRSLTPGPIEAPVSVSRSPPADNTQVNQRDQNHDTLTAFDHSDAVVVITTQEIPSIKNTSLALDLMQTLGVSRDKLVLTINRYDKRIAITPERVGKNLKQEVAAVIPLDEKVVINAVNRGIPFMVDNKAQLAARGIYALSEAVRGCLAAQESEQETPGSGRR